LAASGRPRVNRPRRSAALQGILALLLTAPALAAERIVTLGGDVTEIVFALGAGGQVVGADTSSVYPDAANALPKIGYQRQVPAEGVLALNPTLIIASDEAGPPPALAQLRDAGVRLEIVTAPDSPEGAVAKVEQIAALLERPQDGARVVAALRADLARADARRQAVAATPRVLFVYARGANTIMIGGHATGADEMIRLAGGRNAVDGVDGFKPLTAEAAVAAAPDVILVMSRGVDSLGGADALWAQPGLAQTPAAQQRRLVVMDDLYLLGFGPRLGAAVLELQEQLHPEKRAAR
jgi:iron complex transport system substrate-binding protein